jgi:MFS family permease
MTQSENLVLCGIIRWMPSCCSAQVCLSCCAKAPGVQFSKNKVRSVGGIVMTIAIGHDLDRADRRRRIWAIFGSSSGNLVEWYDFYAYAFAALYFAPSFFPNGNQTTQLLQTAAVFAIGFFMRPIGGYVFGFIADKYGRKNSMMISVLMMCAGSLAIAVLPAYAMIGTAAPVLLLLARMLQGLSVGGEYGTSATYMSEVALPGKRGFYASFQ